MSRDLFGEFGSFQTSTSNPTSDNAFPPPSSRGNSNDLLGPFGPSASTSEAIIPGDVFDPNRTTTLFSNSPHRDPIDEDDDFGDFAVEPLPSSDPTFGPLSNSSPPPNPIIIRPEIQEGGGDDDFGAFISTPRVPTPPPTFSLSSTMTNGNYLHPPYPPPPLHQLLPVLTTQLLSPLPFLMRLKPLSYPAKQRLLASPKVKSFFMAIVLLSHVVGRLIASKKVRGRRSYKGKIIEGNKKNEGMKDEREVSECVREYNEVVGSLRAVVRGMGVAVVELDTDMAVSSNTNMNNSKGKKKVGEFCWLCGLSPIDRVVKLKEDEVIGSGKDIDGKERWMGGWGHRGCRNWWGGCNSQFKT